MINTLDLTPEQRFLDQLRAAHDREDREAGIKPARSVPEHTIKVVSAASLMDMGIPEDGRELYAKHEMATGMAREIMKHLDIKTRQIGEQMLYEASLEVILPKGVA